MLRPSHHDPTDPSAGHLVLLGTYAGVVGLSAAALGRRRAIAMPEPGDIALLGVAAFKLSRLIAKERVTEPLREPFVEDPGGEGDGPKPTGGPLRRAVGELLTCPFCVSVWAATAATLGFAVAPRATRLATSGLASMAVSDVAQYLYAGVRKLE